MATTPNDTAASVDPATIDPDEIELPREVGERARVAFDLESRPGTYGEWAAGIVATFESGHDRSLSTDDLCDVEESPHAATVDGETTNYMCAQDPLVVGLLAHERVTVESTPPNRAEPVRIEFGPSGEIGVHPEGALFSFGIEADVEPPASVTPEAMYRLTCPYGHAFPDDAAYEEWAERTDAVTDVLSVPTGIAVMAALIEAAGVESLS